MNEKYRQIFNSINNTSIHTRAKNDKVLIVDGL